MRNALRYLLSACALRKPAESPGPVLQDFSEFSGIPLSTIRARIKKFPSLMNREWDRIPSNDHTHKAREFYSGSEYYIYDLLSYNPGKEKLIAKLNRFNPEIIKLVREHPGKEFLEFGGGTGLFCEIACEFGKHVTYLDVPGKISDFAQWRFNKYGIRADIIIVDPVMPLELNGQYDIIFTDAALEHVVDPVQVAGELSSHVRDNGLLVLLIDLSGPSDKFHMHRACDIQAIHGAVKSSGLRNLFGEHTYCSAWKKDMRKE
ncbi:MAG: methyltransferase domain-containing protein [Candidatus Omnitrophica bacterium]|nr:methyltransferase domain-containing protein [Candidatus Omnitrophota bacterium]